MLKKQLSGLPESQREQVMEAVEKNPELFSNIAQEVQDRVKNGEDQQTAAMAVFQEHADELRTAFGKEDTQ